MSRFQPDADYRTFLALLVQEREQRGVTPDELAARLHLPPRAVAAYEAGQRQLDFVQTRLWCVALGVPFLDFMLRLEQLISRTQNAPNTAAPNTAAPNTAAPNTAAPNTAAPNDAPDAADSQQPKGGVQ